MAGLLALIAACRAPQDPARLMEAAIVAQGGHERLARFDNVKVVSHGRFKGRLETTGTASLVAPATWAVELRLGGHPAMQFGMDGDRCWRRDRQFVSDCSAHSAQEQRRFGEVLRLRFLRGLQDQHFVSAGEREVDGTKMPAVSMGDLVLAFDPRSHRLVQVSAGARVERYSDFRQIDGALVATTRTLFIDGRLDVKETWDEILPGQADLALLRPPPPAQDGETIDEVDAERWVAVADLRDLEADLTPTVRSLDEFAKAQGQTVSDSDGVVFTAVDGEGPAQAHHWEVAIGLEPTAGGLPSNANLPFRFERWPDMRFVGIFHRGDPRGSAAKQLLLRQLMERVRVRPAAGTHWQFVCTRESLTQPAVDRLCLLRRAVVPSPSSLSESRANVVDQ